MSLRNARRRPLAKSLTEAVILGCVIAAVLYGLKTAGVVDLGTGPLQAVDGDSLRRGAQNIRLFGIDAPELRQTCRDANGKEWPCGREAKEALRNLIARRDAACASYDRDRYGRSVATCKIGGLDLNAEMVRQGWAIAYRDHSFAYVGAEAEARKARRGIWRGTFEAPQAYRERLRLNRGDVGEMD